MPPSQVLTTSPSILGHGVASMLLLGSMKKEGFARSHDEEPVSESEPSEHASQPKLLGSWEKVPAAIDGWIEMHEKAVV